MIYLHGCAVNLNGEMQDYNALTNRDAFDISS